MRDCCAAAAGPGATARPGGPGPVRRARGQLRGAPLWRGPLDALEHGACAVQRLVVKLAVGLDAGAGEAGRAG
jgi:hypothetical protein